MSHKNCLNYQVIGLARCFSTGARWLS